MGTILILGAGASKGANLDNYPKPPITTEFFKTAEELGILIEYKPLIKYIQNNIGISLDTLFNYDIEALFSQIEFTFRTNILEDSEIQKIDSSFSIVSPYDYLCSLVNDVVFLTTRNIKLKRCNYHMKIFKKLLKNDDAIIDFNYDLIADICLKHLDMLNSETGYGWFRKYLDESEKAKHSIEVKLLKPHGSLNWEKNMNCDNGDDIIIKEPIDYMSVNHAGAASAKIKLANYLKTNRGEDSMEYFSFIKQYDNFIETPLLPYIVYPSPFKEYANIKKSRFKDIWRSIKNEIIKHDKIISIGFNFKDEDFNQLLSDCSSIKGKSIYIENVNRKEKFDANEAVWNNLKQRGIIVKNTYKGYIEEFATSI